MTSSVLLYTLLALWLLPAAALVVVYCMDIVYDHMQRYVAWWHCFWAQRAIRTRTDVQRVISFRQSAATGGAAPVIPEGVLPVRHADATLGRVSPLAASDHHMHIPHVVEEADGQLYVEQWDVSLN